MIDTCYVGDVRDGLRAFIAAGIRAQTCITSPPYWGLRDYGVEGQLGLEPTPQAFITNMVDVFRGVRDVLADDGTLWLNMGDSYAASRSYQVSDRKNPGAIPTGHDSRARPPVGLKQKDLCGMPWRLAFALQADGWWLRRDIIWHKPNPMPETAKDRPTTAHEYLFLLAKRERYYYDADAIAEPASADTHARYARGRSDTHKWADGGPGNQTIAKGFEHMRGPADPGRLFKPVAGWATGAGDHSAAGHAKEMAGRDGKLLRKVYPGNGVGFGHGYDAVTKPRVKNNASFDEAMAEMPQTRNKRSVWTIPSEPFPEAHFATFPTALVEPCVLAGSRIGDVVLDPFLGSGTVAQVAQALGRHWIGCELNPDYLAMQANRTAQRGLALA